MIKKPITSSIMASSSSSFPPSRTVGTSSSPLLKHQVFLSFRGADTRKTFVDHLYLALQREGIFAYKDDQTLPRGESIGPSIIKAIQESQIAVIVFSKNFVDSSWCLDELECIMECKDERGQIVFPIFYNVDPSELRYQKGEFGKAFAKQVSTDNNKVESWKKALFGAANISGWETKYIANGHEAKCIKKIVGEISNRLNDLVSSGDEDLIGIETHMQDLLSKLKIESRGVRMVGIWGIGGGGKSTLAYSVYKKISHDFDGYCFIGNIWEEASKSTSGLIKLQKKVLQDVLRSKNVAVRSIEEGKDMIKSRLFNRSVLIVLDDVDHLDHLRMLAGSKNWFGDGSRIIITTRNEHFIRAHCVDEIYNVCLLDNDEAMKLFLWHAFREDRPKQGYEKASIDVVSKGGGLPLALKVFGSFLYDKDMGEWMDALARLENIPHNEIVEKLKISYDGLTHNEKELFLDIACFFKGRRKEYAMEILDACGFYPIIGVKVLIQKALITIVNGFFDMHDMVQEMGHHIIQGKHPNNPEKHIRVWQKEQVLNLCNRDAAMENHKIKALYSDHSLPPDVGVVLNMKKLRFLSIRSDSTRQCHTVPEFLSNESQWIDWMHYPASSLPATFQATKLCCLILTRGLQKQLWNGYKLQRSPNIDGLPCLESMRLRGCKDLEVVDQSTGRHEGLVFLDLKYCSNLKNFPPIIRMKKLETLVLFGCLQLKSLEIKTNMDGLVNLFLGGSGIEVVSSSIGQYCTNMLYLELRNCYFLKSIEGNFQLLKHLKRLELWGCERLETLPEDLFDVECSLEVLSLPPKRQSRSSKHLPVVFKWKFRDLPCFLRRLDLSMLELVDEDITSNICGLCNLQLLDLSGNNFSRLHSKLSKLPQLKFLDISNCSRLMELPELPSSIAILKANDCELLETDGDFPTKLKWLWKVSLFRKENKQGVIDGDKILQSMLQRKAIESHFLSFHLAGHENPNWFVPWMVEGKNFTLQLQQHWYNDFNGFLIQVFVPYQFRMTYTFHPLYIDKLSITLNHEVREMGALMGIDYLPKLWGEWSNFTGERHYPSMYVAYVSFSSLSHTRWWNSTCNTISFCMEEDILFKQTISGIGVVPWKSNGKVAAGCSEFWDEEDYGRKTFEIIRDSKSALELSWTPSFFNSDVTKQVSY